jgi:hypothetical protein
MSINEKISTSRPNVQLQERCQGHAPQVLQKEPSMQLTCALCQRL